MSEVNPITATFCEKMTGTGVHHVEHSTKKFRDPHSNTFGFSIEKFTDKETHSEHISRSVNGRAQYLSLIHI